MFRNHVIKELSAYCHDELGPEDSRRVAEHLLGCQRCRKEFEEIKLGINLAELLPTIKAPASMWNEMESLLSEERSHRAAPRPKRDGLALLLGPLGSVGFGWRIKGVAVFSALFFLVLSVGAIWFYIHSPQSARKLAGSAHTESAPITTLDQSDESKQLADEKRSKINDSSQARVSVHGNNRTQIKPNNSGEHKAKASFEVVRLEGAPIINSGPMGRGGRLGIGEWLKTDGSSRAKINVADIGHVEIEPNTRVRLLKTRSTEHRLALARGRLHAMIYAPPRLFFVETPSAVAVDYGCAYTLEVDDRGNSLLHVTAGWVALEHGGRESMVPAGAVCRTRPRIGPGTPYFADAPLALRSALEKFDFKNNSREALEVVLAESRQRDTLTLWHLLSRVPSTERSFVYDRLAILVSPPAGVTRDGVLRLDKQMLHLWKDELEWVW